MYPAEMVDKKEPPEAVFFQVVWMPHISDIR